MIHSNGPDLYDYVDRILRHILMFVVEMDSKVQYAIMLKRYCIAMNDHKWKILTGEDQFKYVSRVQPWPVNSNRRFAASTWSVHLDHDCFLFFVCFFSYLILISLLKVSNKYILLIDHWFDLMKICLVWLSTKTDWYSIWMNLWKIVVKKQEQIQSNLSNVNTIGTDQKCSLREVWL